LRPRRSRRAGSTFLELQVALVVFSIAIAGLCPLVVMQSRLIRKLETQAVGSPNPQLIPGVRMLDGQPAPVQGSAGDPVLWTALQPQPDAWVRRLGVAATFLTDLANAPAQTFTPAVKRVPPGPLNTVAITAATTPISGGLSVKVQVTSP
jgi:hypothetical protein